MQIYGLLSVLIASQFITYLVSEWILLVGGENDMSNYPTIQVIGIPDIYTIDTKNIKP